MPTIKTQEHAAVEKPQSKPGRKPLTSEPKNKRTAQNRAAQRAFRERKERRMKELEEKVALLEKEKMQIENESELLRSQVSSLMKQLNDVNGGITISSASSSVSPLEDKLFTTNSTSIVTPSTTNEFIKLQTNLPSNASISSSASMSYFGDGESIKLTPDSNEDSDLNLNLKNKLNNKNFKGHYDEQVFCNELGEACGSKGCPIPKAKSNISSISSSVSSPLGLIGTKSIQTGSSQTGSTKENGEINNSDDYLSNILLDKKISKESPKPTDWNFAIDSAFSKPNEMDFLFADDSKTLDTEKLIQNNPSAFMFDSNKSDQFDFDFDINENDIFEDLLKLPQEGQDDEQNLIVQNEIQNNSTLKRTSPGVFDAGHLSDDDEEVPDNTRNLLHCSQIWERITTHPRFTELDIDNLCEELKQKAKCSDTGVVVDGNEVGKMLQNVMKGEQTAKRNTRAEQMKKLISGTDGYLVGM